MKNGDILNKRWRMSGDRHSLLAILMAETLLYHILFCIGWSDVKPGV